MTHLTEEDLILLYYNEPDAPRHGKTHLLECGECQAAADSLARALSVCNEWAAPERPPEFGRDVWLQLVPRLESQPKASRGWLRLWSSGPVRIWTAAACLAVLLVTVFFAGRYSRPAQPQVMAGLSDQARERILAIAVADHLDRVQILLTEIANTSGADPETFSNDKNRAEDLVQEGRLMRQTLAAQGETATAGFLDEVEPFLVETAHTPDGASAHEVAELRERIESGSLLFKVRIVESNLRNEEEKL